MKFRTLSELDHSEGTVQLVEELNSAHAHHHLKGTNVVLIPQPSNDPNDPLRWSQWKKYVVFLNVCCFTFLTNVTVGGLSPAFYGLSLEFHRSMNTTAGLLTWPVLVLGLGNFFWGPTAIYIGKRPVFVLASLLLLASNIWAALSPTFNSLLAARIVSAFAGASTESLGAAIVNDLFYLHERGSKMGIYIIFLSWGNGIGPLIAGFIVTSVGWRWFCWVCVIFTGLNFLSVVLFVPETRFYRSVDLWGLETPASQEEKNASTRTENATEEIPSILSAKRTWTQEKSLWSGATPGISWWGHFVRPFPLLLYPAVFWAFFSYSVILALIVAISTLNSFVLQAPPYSFSPGINGLINIPAIIGNLVGAISGGYMTDRYAAWRASQLGGFFKPETRLVLLVIPAVFVPAGLLMFGFGAQHHLHWAILYVGYGCINVGLTAVPSIGMTYTMDSYYPVAAEALFLINGLKNVVAFGFTYGIVPWITKAGYQEAFGTMAGIYLGVLCLAIPLYIFGPQIRHTTSTKFKLICW